jgi:hypothetical protein
LRSPLFEWMGEEYPYPFRSQMASMRRPPLSSST